jgi:hypothetical protein
MVRLPDGIPRRALFATFATFAAALTGCGGGSMALPPPPTTLTTRNIASVGTFGVADATSGIVPVGPLALTWPKGAPNSGDVLLACVENQYQVKATAPSGWTTLSQTTTGFGSALFFKIAGTAEPASVSFALPSSGNVSAAMVRVTGAAMSTPQFTHLENSGASITTTGLIPSVLGMLPLACFGGVPLASFSVAAGYSSLTQSSTSNHTYDSLMEQSATLTADTKTAISVATTDTTASSSTQNDAYGILVAPGAAATATPVPTPTPTAPATPPPSTGGPAFADANGGSISVAPLSLSWPKGAPHAGDLLLACIENQWNVTATPPMGWSALSSTASAFGSSLFERVAGAGEPATVVFALPSSGNISASMVRITGAASSGLQFAHSETSGTSATTPSLVPSVLGMLPVACFGGISLTSYSVASGWSLATQSMTSSKTYTTLLEMRSTLTTSTSTGVIVTTTGSGATSSTQNDAYGILVAPASAATTTPTAPPTASPTSAPTAPPTATPTTAPSPSALTLNPSSVSFLAIPSAAQMVTASQTGNTSFTASSTNCSGIATITPAGGSGTFSVSPVAVGTCAFTITGAGGQSMLLAVSVTVTQIIIN